MGAETGFRKALIDAIGALANSRELDDRLVRVKYVEDKTDLLGEILDYYTDDLLQYEAFAEEFCSGEISELRDFLCFITEALRGSTAWSEVQTRSANLLACLGGSAGQGV